MALHSHDRTLADLDDGGFDDIWHNDLLRNSSVMSNDFNSADDVSSSSGDTMDPNWLNDLFFDDPTILNDRMISDALEPHVVHGEHSYSIDNSNIKMETVVIKDEPIDKDFDVDIMGTDTDSPSASSNSTGPLSAYGGEADNVKVEWKCEPMDDQPYGTMPASSAYYTPRPSPPSRQTLLKQSRHNNAHHHQQGHDSVRLHNVDIHLEVVKSESLGEYDDGLPPTPPSSSASDSEGGQSPQRSAPSSPSSRPSARSSPRSLSSQSMFISPQVNANGMLMLTEEEKRTLIAEGYPIPSKLPLSKADERNLKKVRRKIKNKISAQESRRKKKEYMECLEKRMEGYSRENEGLRKKVDYLESSNRSLMSQLQKLQNLVSRMRPSPQSTQTGTCLMVLVLFFSVFLGSWSPMSWSIGSLQHTASTNVPLPASPAFKPALSLPLDTSHHSTIDDYLTPNVRSRVLMSMPDDEYGEDVTSAGDSDYLFDLLPSSLLSCMAPATDTKTHLPDEEQHTIPKVAEDSALGVSVNVAVISNDVVTTHESKNATGQHFHRCDTAANCLA